MTMNATEKQAVKDLKETIDRLNRLLLKSDTLANKHQKQIDDLEGGLMPHVGQKDLIEKLNLDINAQTNTIKSRDGVIKEKQRLLDEKESQLAHFVQQNTKILNDHTALLSKYEQLNKALIAAIGWMNCQNGLDYLGREIVAVGIEAEDAAARFKDHDDA